MIIIFRNLWKQKYYFVKIVIFLFLQIWTSPKAIAGEWKIELDLESCKTSHSYSSPSNIFMLYNPWCKG